MAADHPSAAWLSDPLLPEDNVYGDWPSIPEAVSGLCPEPRVVLPPSFADASGAPYRDVAAPEPRVVLPPSFAFTGAGTALPASDIPVSQPRVVPPPVPPPLPPRLPPRFGGGGVIAIDPRVMLPNAVTTSAEPQVAASCAGAAVSLAGSCARWPLGGAAISDPQIVLPNLPIARVEPCVVSPPAIIFDSEPQIVSPQPTGTTPRVAPPPCGVAVTEPDNPAAAIAAESQVALALVGTTERGAELAAAIASRLAAARAVSKHRKKQASRSRSPKRKRRVRSKDTSKRKCKARSGSRTKHRTKVQSKRKQRRSRSGKHKRKKDTSKRKHRARSSSGRNRKKGTSKRIRVTGSRRKVKRKGSVNRKGSRGRSADCGNSRGDEGPSVAEASLESQQKRLGALLEGLGKFGGDSERSSDDRPSSDEESGSEEHGSDDKCSGDQREEGDSHNESGVSSKFSDAADGVSQC